MTHPEYPIVEGRYEFARGWSLQLPGRFKRRVEDGDLFLWRPGLTVVLAVWGDKESPREVLEWLRGDMSPGAYDVADSEQGGLLRFSYRLREEADDARVDALYGFAVATDAHLQIAVYFDRESDLEMARVVLDSVDYAPHAAGQA